jgi:molybdenum cofactor guanylyltransferase
MKLSAIILAGGRSRRMGRNKALMPFRGKPLIRYSIDLAQNFTRNILISSNYEELQGIGFPLVHDIFSVNAPLAGIHSGLLTSSTGWNLVLTCDMPNVSAETIRYLITKLEKKKSLILPGHDGYIEPLCGFYHRSLIPIIEKNFNTGKLSPLDLLETERYSIVPMEGVLNKDLSFIFKNMNEKKDFLNE